MSNIIRYLLSGILVCAVSYNAAEAKKKNSELWNTDMEFFKTEEARRIGDQVLMYQRVTGGWPQFWPENRDYQIHITYNDNAMVNTMNLIRDMMYGKAPYDGGTDLITPACRKRLFDAFYRGGGMHPCHSDSQGGSADRVVPAALP